MYLVKTPVWLMKLYGGCTWRMPNKEKALYLTFDDGPQPGITDFVLEELDKYNAKATFFCIGQNVRSNPDVYAKILLAGHSVGNHTNSHLNGWKVSDREYLNDIEEAGKWIDSQQFRPPYGRITHFQVKMLKQARYKFKPVMWTVLSGDFDEKINGEKCLRNVMQNAGNGSIVVFHDSLKAEPRLTFCLPKILNHFNQLGYTFKKIEEKDLK